MWDDEKGSYIEVLNNKIYLDTQCSCSNVDYNGKVTKKKEPSYPPMLDDEGRCHHCKDTGWELTESGESILEFIRKHP